MACEEPQRLFFAVPLTDEIRAAAQAAQAELSAPRAAVKWVAPENLHFTLKFLGDTPVSAVPALAEVARQVAERHAAFEVEVRGLGSFPPRRPPDVLWAGCGAGGEEFVALGADLDSALAAAGLAEPERRPFTPHLTLGRVRRGAWMGSGLPDLVNLLCRHADRPLGEMRVDRFLLLSSRLGPQGSAYTTVETFDLMST